jgi:hypothetical protein
MEDGISIYQGLIDVIGSGDLARSASFIQTLEKKCMQDRVSFYAMDAIVSDLQKFLNRLESSDSRGLKGKGKGSTKQDVVSVCKYALKVLVKRKNELKERERASQPDHAEQFRDFLPLGFVRNPANALSIPETKRKQKARR